MCLILFAFMNLVNSSDTNCDPLSLTTCCGIPHRANKFRSWSIFWVVVVPSIIITLGHFKYASTATKTFCSQRVPQSQYEFAAKALQGTPMDACNGASFGFHFINKQPSHDPGDFFNVLVTICDIEPNFSS